MPSKGSRVETRLKPSLIGAEMWILQSIFGRFHVVFFHQGCLHLLVIAFKLAKSIIEAVQHNYQSCITRGVSY